MGQDGTDEVGRDTFDLGDLMEQAMILYAAKALN